MEKRIELLENIIYETDDKLFDISEKTNELYGKFLDFMQNIKENENYSKLSLNFDLMSLEDLIGQVRAMVFDLSGI